jgi:predicted double-glycine peptidase
MRISIIGLLGAISLAAGMRLEVPFFRQEKNGCGGASAAMILHYWAVQQPTLALPRPSAAAVHQELDAAEARGVPLADLRRYFEERRFHAFTLRASWADLEGHLSKGRPVLACLKNRPNSELHYVVVVGLDAKRVWLNDPAKRKPSSLDRPKFDQRWALAGRWVLLAVPRGER